MSNILDTIKKELLSWPYVTTEPHRFGGLEFRLNKREMGHIHGDRVADLPFSMDVRNLLVNSARVSAHHFLPQSGWVSYWIFSNCWKYPIDICTSFSSTIRMG